MYLSIVFYVFAAILPVLIEKVKGKSSGAYKLSNLSKALAFVIIIYVLVLVSYKSLFKTELSFASYTALRIATAISFFIGAFKYTPIWQSKKDLLIYPKINMNSRIFIVIIMSFAYSALGLLWNIKYHTNDIFALPKNIIVLNAAINNPLTLIIYLIIMLLYIVGEEFIFRYFAINAFKNSLSMKLTIVISSLIWTLMHLSPTLDTFIVGVFLGFLYYKTGSIILCIFLHYSYNIVIYSEIFYLYLRYENIISISPIYYSAISFIFLFLFYSFIKSIMIRVKGSGKPIGISLI